MRPQARGRRSLVCPRVFESSASRDQALVAKVANPRRRKRSGNGDDPYRPTQVHRVAALPLRAIRLERFPLVSNMIRVFALLTVLAMTVAIFAACGSGGNSSTGTVTATSSGVAGTWTISGQLMGSIELKTSGCEIGPPAGSQWGAQLAGTLNGTVIGVSLASRIGGTVDLGSTDIVLSVHYGDVGLAINDYWATIYGSAGARGSVTINSDGSGSMNATLPPSLATTSGAAQPITISGQWDCRTPRTT